jgi:hypothetical protein
VLLEASLRFNIAAILAGIAWWAIGLTVVPDLFLRRSPASLIVVVITCVLLARMARPFYRGSAMHLVWLTPASVYLAAAVVGYLLPLATEQAYALERCLEMIRGFWRDATFSFYVVIVFPAALLTHWLLRMIERSNATLAAPVPQESRRLP